MSGCRLVLQVVTDNVLGGVSLLLVCCCCFGGNGERGVGLMSGDQRSTKRRERNRERQRQSERQTDRRRHTEGLIGG